MPEVVGAAETPAVKQAGVAAEAMGKRVEAAPVAKEAQRRVLMKSRSPHHRNPQD